MKILGWWTNIRSSLDTQANTVISEVANKIQTFNQIKKYTSQSTRLSFTNGYLCGKIQYGLPLFYPETLNIREK